MNNKFVYQVRHEYGYYFVKHIGGEYLSFDEMEDFIASLQQTLEKMARWDMSQEELRHDILTDRLEKAVQEWRIEYPFEAPYATWKHGMHRPTKTERYTGVYFLRHKALQNEIKIGKTTDLYTRSRSLYHMLKSEDRRNYMEAVAFIRTPHIDEVERLVHTQFREHRLNGEWFKAKPVINWLEGMKDDN